jgi:hypothetical protein
MVHIVAKTARTKKKAGLCSRGENLREKTCTSELTFPISRSIQNGILEGMNHKRVYAQLRIAYCGDVSHV